MLAGTEFDGESLTCRACLTTPVARAPRPAGSGPVTRRAAPTRPAPAEPGPRAPLLGVSGMGDFEVRERRAKRAAYEALAEQYPEEYEQLLQAARRAEGLRA
ncbi:MAG: hypothetical protein M3P93_03295 [Actinomycetota bacterium]|nr:hypothetical protein [Actinomycetota bacterium]